MIKIRFIPFITFIMILSFSTSSIAVEKGHFFNENISIPAGIIFESNFYQQWGLELGYTDQRMCNDHLYFHLSYTTSRLQAITNNSLKKDNLTFGSQWLFGNLKTFTLYTGADLGWTHFDIEEEEIFGPLKNDALLINARTGVRAFFWNRKVQPWIDLGYCVVTSSTVNPLLITAGVQYDICKGLSK